MFDAPSPGDPYYSITAHDVVCKDSGGQSITNTNMR